MSKVRSHLEKVYIIAQTQWAQGPTSPCSPHWRHYPYTFTHTYTHRHIPLLFPAEEDMHWRHSRCLPLRSLPHNTCLSVKQLGPQLLKDRILKNVMDSLLSLLHCFGIHFRFCWMVFLKFENILWGKFLQFVSLMPFM